MKNAFGSGYVEIKFKDKRLEFIVTGFKYTHAEEQDDQCDIQIHSDDPTVVDDPAFATNAEWVVTWGIIENVLISHTEKIYIEEVVPNFDKDGISLSIIAHDKATVLKKSTSMAIHKEASLPAVVATEAKKHGIKTYIEKTPDPSQSNLFTGDLAKTIEVERAKQRKEFEDVNFPVQSPAQINKAINNPLNTLAKDYYADKSNYLEVEPGVFKEYSVIHPGVELLNKALYDQVASGKLDPTKVKLAAYYLRHYDKYKNIPQANRTPAQLAAALAKRNSNGPFYVSGHGDSIIIKARNTKKKPILSYTYAGGNGELLTFKPETKHKSKQSGSTATNFTGWNSMDKEAYYGKVQDGNNPSVGSYTGGGGINKNNPEPNAPNLLYLKSTSPIQAGNLGLGFAVRDNLVNNTLVPFLPNQEDLPINKENQEKLNALNTANKQKVSPAKDILDAYGNAANAQAKDAYEQNPGSFLAIGNPIIISGEVVNITNVGKAYSGNWYITKATHDLDPLSGYLVTAEIARNTVGNSVKNTKIKSTTKASTKLINDEVRSKTFDNHKTRVVHVQRD